MPGSQERGRHFGDGGPRSPKEGSQASVEMRQGRREDSKMTDDKEDGSITASRNDHVHRTAIV
jgi:hypothetical protein